MTVSLYDTTLRDGTQGTGVNFSSRDKLRIAHELDGFGIHYIEGGWPGSNPKDVEFFELAKKEKFKTREDRRVRQHAAQGHQGWRTIRRCGCCSRRRRPW